METGSTLPSARAGCTLAPQSRGTGAGGGGDAMKKAFVAAAAVLTAVVTSGSGFAQEKVVVWWNKGFYEAEDKALAAVIRNWEAANPDKKIELTFIPLTDVIP